MDISKMNILFYDLGLFPEMAARMARDCAAVKYYCLWPDPFPEIAKAKVGENFEGVERVDRFYKHKDWADAIIVPDTNCGDIVDDLINQELPVAGVGMDSEDLEGDRMYGREVQEKAGLPTQDTLEIPGLEKLKLYLQKHKNLFIKIDRFRGVLESFRHFDYKDSEGEIDYIAFKAGPFKDDIKFIVEELIKGIEPGMDPITWNGDLMYPTMGGYERKGAGYISRTYMDESELPEAFRKVHEGFAPVFRRNGTRFFYSMEMKLTKSRKPYVIDPTMRLAAPGTSAVQFEAITNYSPVVCGLATGERVDPIIEKKHGAAVCFSSPKAERRWLNISFPKSMRQWLKFRMAARHEEDYYSIPGFDSVCTVVGLGDTVKEAVDLVKERAKEVHAAGLDTSTDGLDQIMEDIEEGHDYGINF